MCCMKKLFTLLPLLSIFTVTSCNFATPSNSIESKENNSSSDSISSTSSSSSESIPYEEDPDAVNPSFTYSQEDYDDFFDPTKNVEVVVKISNEAIYKLAQYCNAGFTKSEMYHPCEVVIKIDGEERFSGEEVGLRMKGNTSKNPNFVDDSGHLRECVHFKMSFNKTFDSETQNDYYIRTWEDSNERKARKDRTFGEMKKIDFKWNRNEDKTFTKEAYCKEMYRDAGVLAQNMNLVKFTLETDTEKQTYTYQAIECVDSSMMKKYYAKAASKGNLYKGIYARADLTTDSLSGIGVESETCDPWYSLKTNDDEPDHTLLTNVINVLNKRSTAEQSRTELKEILNIDQILKYMALSWVAGNPDDLRNNANNTYFYFDSTSNKMSIIPYDDDRVFGILHTWSVDTSDLPDFSTRMQGMTAAQGGNKVWQKNPLFWKLILSEDQSAGYSSKWPVIQEYQNRYLELCKEYANKYLDANRFQEFTNQFVNAPSKDISDAGADNQTFAYYANRKKGVLSL